MSLEQITAEFQKRANEIDPLGGTLKLALDKNIVYIDGSGDTNQVSNEDTDADCIITTSMENFQKLQSGDLNPMMAVMSGKVKVAGNMGLAMKLQALLG